jgi:hypothetical protein
MSVRLSHMTTWKSLDGSVWNLIAVTFTEICCRNIYFWVKWDNTDYHFAWKPTSFPACGSNLGESPARHPTVANMQESPWRIYTTRPRKVHWLVTTLTSMASFTNSKVMSYGTKNLAAYRTGNREAKVLELLRYEQATGSSWTSL